MTITPVLYLVIILISVVVLVLMMSKLKLHPVAALFIVATIQGLVFGYGLTGTFDVMSGGFGGTMGNIGFPIILGAMLAMAVRDTGATTAIANFFIRRLKGKHLELAMGFTAFILSIPVFGDITTLLVSPISNVLAKRKKQSMMVMGTYAGLGLGITHGLVPPTPGILAVALMLGTDLGLAVIWGVVIGLIGFLAAYFIWRRYYEKQAFLEPKPEFVQGIESAVEADGIEGLLIKEDNTPNAFASFLPLLLPALLLAAGSIATAVLPEGSAALPVFAALGHRVVALGAGVIAACFLIIGRKQKVIANSRQADPSIKMSEKPGLGELVLGNWLLRGMKIAATVLFITCMGGAMSRVLNECPASGEVGNLVMGWGVPPIIFVWVLSAVIMAAVGSFTTASITSAGLVLPMLPLLGISPLAATLAIGTGVMLCSHVNNSGFWVHVEMFNMDMKQGLKSHTLSHATAGVAGFLVVLLLNTLHII